MDALKHVTIREQYVKRLRRLVWTTSQNFERLQFLLQQKPRYRNQAVSLVDQEKLLLRIQELQKQMVTLFRNIRDVTCDVVHGITAWRKALHKEDFRNLKSEPKLHCFYFNEQNYLQKLTKDLDWLDSCPFMADWFGFELKGNCMIIPPLNFDARKVLMERRAVLIEQYKV